MKKIIYSLLLLSGYAAQAQDLAVKIPKNAMAVASVQGSHFLEMMTIGEFNKSVLGKKILESASNDKEKGAFTSIEDLGVKLSGTMYYYTQQTDSIGYHCLLIPLSDARKFELIFKESKRSAIKRNGDIRTLYGSGETMLQWNNDYAYLVMGNLKTGFIERDSAMSARYGIKTVSVYDYSHTSDVAVETVTDAVDIVEEPAMVEVSPVMEPTEDMETVESVKGDPEAVIDITSDPDPPSAEEVYASPMVAEEDVEMVTAPAEDNYGYDNLAYERAYETQREIKRKLTKEWLEAFAIAGFLQNNMANSILSNPDYVQSLDKDAAATFYLSSMQNVFNSILPSYYNSLMPLNNYMTGFGSINAKLFLGKKDMRITTEMQVDDEKAASYKKIYNHKLNKKFAKYVNTDRMVGFIGSAINTEAYLKEMPQLMNNTYGKVLGMYGEEIGIGAELISLLLDEKAVAKVIKGDALLLLTDVGPKEYTYTSYEYNEDNYEREEVTKKKTETLPDFLFMMSTDDTHLIERLLTYGIHKEEIVLKNGIYSLSGKLSRKSPFGIHILIKDGILFCGTSLKDISEISLDRFQGNITKEEKKLLLSNNFSMFFNPKNLKGKISEKEFGNSASLKSFNDFLGTVGSIYARSSVLKSNRISGEMVAEVPEGNENSLKYFFSLIENGSKIENSQRSRYEEEPVEEPAQETEQ